MILLNQMMAVADEFDVIVIEIEFFFVQVFFVIVEQRADPCFSAVCADGGVRAADRIRRISQYHHNRRVALDGVGGVRLGGEPIGKERLRIRVMLLQRIRQVNVETFRFVRLIAGFFKQQIQFRMRHCIRRHQQLEPVQARQQVIFDITAPCALHHFEARDINSFDDFDEKRAGADARIKELHFMRIALNRRGAPLFLDFDRDGGRVG